jgi:hypothetical protein
VPLASPATRNPPASPPSIEAIAAAQKDLITWDQLRASGLSASAISHRVKVEMLHRRHRRVYSLGPAPLSYDAQCLAAVLAAGPGSALAKAAAAYLLGARRTRPPLIAVVSTRRRRIAGVRVHTVRSLDPRDITIHKGIPVTTIHRTIVDLADELTPHELANVIHEAAFLGRWIEAAVRDCATRLNGRHHHAVLEHAIALYNTGSAGTKSKAELALALHATGAQNNVRVEDIEVDFHWPDLRLIVEIDGHQHGRPTTTREDKLKHRILETAGYKVLRFPDTTPPETIVSAVRCRAGTPARPG